MVHIISKKKEYAKPKYCPSEGRYFKSNAEVDEYMEENDLRLSTRPGRTNRKKAGVRTYKYDKKLKKVVEVL